MFKGTLIEDQNYYNLRSRQLLYVTVLSLILILLIKFFQISIWVIVGVVLTYVAIIFLTSRTRNKMVNFANKNIEIAPDQIRLKDSNGTLLEAINIRPDHVIKVKENYKMAQETMSDLKEEFIGNTEKHFIVIEKNNEERRFDFEITSHYMLNQLSKIVRLWQTENYKVEYV